MQKKFVKSSVTRDQLITLIRTKYADNAVKMEKIVDLVFFLPPEEGVKMLLDLFRFWSLPRQDGTENTEETTFTHNEECVALKNLEKMRDAGLLSFCRPFHDGKNGLEIARDIYNQLSRVNKFEKCVLLNAILQSKHIPYVEVDLKGLEKFTPDNMLNVLAADPDLFSELNFIATREGNLSVVAGFLSKKLSECDDEHLRRCMIAYTITQYSATAAGLTSVAGLALAKLLAGAAGHIIDESDRLADA